MLCVTHYGNYMDIYLQKQTAHIQVCRHGSNALDNGK